MKKKDIIVRFDLNFEYKELLSPDPLNSFRSTGIQTYNIMLSSSPFSTYATIRNSRNNRKKMSVTGFEPLPQPVETRNRHCPNSAVAYLARVL